MPNLLLSGPAGAGKSQLARELAAERGGPVVIADFQALYAAIAGAERGPDGRYPERIEALLPTTEHTRQVVIAAAVQRDLDVIATNSDGDGERRAALLEALGVGAIERVVDPGREVVEARLADPVTGELSPQCRSAIGRWYGRL